MTSLKEILSASAAWKMLLGVGLDGVGQLREWRFLTVCAPCCMWAWDKDYEGFIEKMFELRSQDLSHQCPVRDAGRCKYDLELTMMEQEDGNNGL